MAFPTTGHVILDGTPLIVEPNTYSKGPNQLYGPSPLRLDSPINLSPVSTFKQDNWKGGMGQEHFKDPEMYYLGDADTRFDWAQCAFQFKSTRVAKSGDPLGKNSAKLMELRGTGPNVKPSLWVAASNGSKLFRFSLLSSTPELRWQTKTNKFSALGRSFYGGMYALHIGFTNGDLYAIPSGSNVPEKKARITSINSAITFLDSLGSRGDIAGTSDGRLFKTTSGKWTQFAKVDMHVVDGEQWNQRMWVIGHDELNRSALYVTDTVTTQEVFRWAAAFIAQKIVLHSGQLFILGWTLDDEFTGQIGQIWSYNGASMRLVFEIPDDIWRVGTETFWPFYAATAYRKWLAFGFPHKGVWFYDPETDAIHPGPKPDFNLSYSKPGTNDYPAAMVDYGGHLAVLLRDSPYLFFEDSVKEYIPSYVMTSEYDAGFPGQDKTWIRVRVRLKEELPVGTSVQVLYTTEHVESDRPVGPIWQHAATFSTPGETIFEADIPGDPVSSQVIRFQVKLTPSPFNGSADNKTPRVASLEADYLIVPDVKYGWSFRVLGGADMSRPDGQPYGITVGQLQVALNNVQRNSAKRWVRYTDEDGTEYKVQVVDIRIFKPVIDHSNPTSEFARWTVNLAEV